jgi:hypothetical protein
MFVRGDRTQVAAPAIVTYNATATTLRTRGTLYQVTTAAISVGVNKYEVVGNVYASAIDWEALSKTGISNTFYLWDAKAGNLYQGGAYQTFNPLNNYKPFLAGSYGAGTVADPFVTNKLIESGAAFFVTSTTGGTIALNENAKVSGAGRNAFRPSTPVNEIPKLNTVLYSVIDNNINQVDANMVAFDATFSNEVDGLDATKMTNPGENFGIRNGGNKLVIDARKPVEQSTEVVFEMTNVKTQNYQLAFNPTNLNIEGLSAQLKDNYLGTFTNIDLTATQQYAFAVTADAASKAADRFKVVFTKRPTALNNAGFAVSPNPVEGSSVTVQLKNQTAGKYQVRLLSITGQVMMAKTLTHAGGNGNQLLQLPASLASGMYQVELTGADKRTSVQKIIVNEKR